MLALTPNQAGTAATASLATSAIIAGDGSVKIVRPTSSYFDRLGGGGQRLNGKPVASSSSPLGAQPLGEAALPARGAPLGAAGSPLGAMPHAMPLSRSMSATSPTSSSSSSSSSMSGVSFPSTPPAGAPALERSSSLNSSGKKIVTVVENGFRYSYEVASSGARRLLRRDPVDAAALAVSPTAGQGYSLKK
jgi:hypothetical protein